MDCMGDNALRREECQPTSRDFRLEKKIETYWNQRSAAFSQLRLQEAAGPNGEAWRTLLQEHLPDRRLSILDIGTGAGFFPLLLVPLGHEVTGVDLSEKMVQEARKNCLAAGVPARFRKMNAQALDFADESFDVILSRNLTWTLPDVMEAYREWHRVLRPQGIILNFDSDYGCKTFTKTKDADHVHASLSQETLTACNDIKHQLRISQHRRPFWDARFLHSLGMEVSVDADIAPRVQRDPSMHYDDVAVFGIHAKKSS